MSEQAFAFIEDQRARLVRLERFIETPSYDHLLRMARKFAAADPEPWLLDWLVQPMFSEGNYCRLDVAEGENGVEHLLDQLQRVVSGVCA